MGFNSGFKGLIKMEEGKKENKEEGLFIFYLERLPVTTSKEQSPFFF